MKNLFKILTIFLLLNSDCFAFTHAKKTEEIKVSKTLQPKLEITFLNGEKFNLSSKKNQYIRWQWDESEYANTFFEMRIKVDEMTNEVALIITDFCDSEDEEDSRMLWDLAIDDLHRVIGR